MMAPESGLSNAKSDEEEKHHTRIGDSVFGTESAPVTKNGRALRCKVSPSNPPSLRIKILKKFSINFHQSIPLELTFPDPDSNLTDFLFTWLTMRARRASSEVPRTEGKNSSMKLYPSVPRTFL